MTEAPTEESLENFSKEVRLRSPEVRVKYGKELLKEQVDAAKKNNNRPVSFSISERRKILNQVMSDAQGDESARNMTTGVESIGQSGVNISRDYGTNSDIMEKRWEKATSKNGRPPIGGAQDD